MTYLVTGASGFVGAHTVERLVTAGERVVGVDVDVDEPFLAAVAPSACEAGVPIVRADVGDLAGLLRVIQAHGVSKVIHLAGTLLLASAADPLRALHVMGTGTVNVFEAARALGIEKVVWASSSAVYGDRVGDIDDDVRPAPTTVYGSLKLLLEHASETYRERDGVDITAVRYNLVYGFGRLLKARPGGPQQHLLKLIEYPALGRPARVDNGETSWEWVHMDDAVTATLLAASTVRPPLAAYNVTGERATFHEIAEVIRELLPGTDLTVTDGRETTHHFGDYDNATIRRDLQYAPALGLKAGLRKTVNAVREHAGLSTV